MVTIHPRTLYEYASLHPWQHETGRICHPRFSAPGTRNPESQTEKGMIIVLSNDYHASLMRTCKLFGLDIEDSLDIGEGVMPLSQVQDHADFTLSSCQPGFTLDLGYVMGGITQGSLCEKNVFVSCNGLGIVTLSRSSQSCWVYQIQTQGPLVVILGY